MELVRAPLMAHQNSNRGIIILRFLPMTILLFIPPPISQYLVPVTAMQREGIF
jgi:hypothetical protein